MSDGGQTKMGTEYLRHVDGLRGVSVLLVVLYHAWPDLVPGGFIGVDVFFVISGFLITRLLTAERARARFSYAGFLIRRIRRLWPSFALVLTVTLGLGWILLEPEVLAGLGRSALAALGFGANWYFALTTDYFNEGLALNLLLHSWSLSVEEQFYLVYPLVLIGLLKLRHGLLWGLGAIWLISFAAMLLTPAEPATFFATHLRVWELVSGALVFVLTSIDDQLSFRTEGGRWMGLLGLGLILVPALAMPRAMWWPSYVALAPVLGAVLCIVRPWRGLNARWLVGIGLISYALYLWHWPVLQGLGILFPGAPDGVVFLSILVSIGLAYLAWRFVEEPVRRKRVLRRKRDLLAVFLSGTMGLALIGWQYHATEGYPERFAAGYVDLVSAGPDARRGPFACAITPRELAEMYGVDDPDVSELDDFRACRFGAAETLGTSPADLLYVGDSHLGALAQELSERADNAGKSGLYIALAACPPVPDLDWQGQGVERAKACAQLQSLVRDILLTGYVKRAVLVGHWDIYGGQTPAGLDAFIPRFANYLDSVSNKTELHVLLDVPTHDFDVPQALLRELKWPWLGAPNWLRRDEHEAARAPYLELMWAAEAQGRLVLHDPLDAFCPDEVCLARTVDGALFYDGSHVTEVGARLLFDALPDLPR